MCLLTIASRHHEYRSHNLLTLHHAKVIDRQLPASSQYEIHGRHGTRVTVRNLFGNLPVRVKQRGVAIEHKAEHDRLWDLLKREVTGLLLSWREPVSVRIRDLDGKAPISFSSTSPSDGSTAKRSLGPRFPLNLLTQANFVLHDEWSSWVPVSASTATVCVKGAISLYPAPTKRVQFMSVGVTPLSTDAGHNELYDEVNRLFALSSFGTVEHGVAIDNKDETRRIRDERSSSDGYTMKQLKARKGVDRYPMFYLRFSLTNGEQPNRAEILVNEDNANLSTFAAVLKAMITQWLAVHHFRPRQTLPNQVQRQISTASSGRQDRPLRLLSQPRATSALPTSTRAETDSRKRKRSQDILSKNGPDRSHHLAFSAWSRIKSSNSTFLSNLGSKRHTKSSDTEASDVGNFNAPSVDTLDTSPMLAGASEGGGDSDPSVTQSCHEHQEDPDEAIHWVDPTTKKTYLLNARTGCVLPRPLASAQSSASSKYHVSTLKDFNKSLRLQKSTTPIQEPNAWLHRVLSAWENPVFMTAEAGIQQAGPSEDQHNHGCTHGHRWDTDRGHSRETFNTILTSKASKLSKRHLEKAEVVAQLDKKFILVKMLCLDDQVIRSKTDGNALVVIDQHAADERLRVEALLAELCTPLPKGTKKYRSQFGHESRVATTVLDKPIQYTLSVQEQQQFTVHSPRFAAWGILFDVVKSTSPSAKPQPLLSVSALPPVIAERCRADPQVLINFLRAAVWKYAHAGYVPHSVEDLDIQDTSMRNSAAWVRRISSCPAGLVDLVNSRACRSAIMFNDDLGMDECRELVRSLSKCVFPFMCAHGRPSMIPLVEIGMPSSLEPAAKGSFVTAWKRWQKK